MEIKLFGLVFNNIVLSKKLFNYVKDIHRLSGLRVYRWFNLINNSHSILISLNYLSLYKQFLKKKTEKYKINNHTNDISTMAKYGRIYFLRYLTDELNLNLRECFSLKEYDISELYLSATKSNHFDFILLLDQHFSSYVSLPSYKKSFLFAPIHDNMEMIAWFSNKMGQYPSTKGFLVETPLISSVRIGNLKMMQWLLKNRPQDGCIDYRLIQAAFACGHLEILHWLHETKNIPSKFKFDLLFGFSYFHIPNLETSPELECIKWAHQNYRLDEEDILSHGARLSLDVVMYLYENGYQMGCSNAINNACEEGLMDVVKFLHEKGKDCTTRAMDRAAENGHYELVKWLHNNRTEGFSEQALYGSSVEGHLEIFKFLINIAPTYMNYLVIGDYEEMDGLFDDACINGRFDMVKYLSEYHSDKFSATTQAIDQSAKYHNNIDIIKWLKENRTEGCTYKALENSIQCGNLEIVQYLLESGLVVDYSHQDLIQTSIEYSHFDITEWLNNKFVNK